MKSNDKIDRNQLMMTSLDEMIDENSNVRVIDAYVKSLDVDKLGYKVYTNKIGRPAYSPKDLIGLYLYSGCQGDGSIDTGVAWLSHQL